MSYIESKGYLFQRIMSIVKHKIEVEIPKLNNIDLELDDTTSPKTVKSFLKNLPFTVGTNLWGEEVYTDESQIDMGEENAKPTVELFDVAYCPTGKAILLFYLFPNNKAHDSFGFLSVASLKRNPRCTSVKTNCKTIR